MNTHRLWVRLCVAAVVCVIGGSALADTFGAGANQFSIDFVPISGSTNPTSGIPAGDGFAFTGVVNDYRVGKFEITYDQWNKFKASLGVPVTGYPSRAYDGNPGFTGTNLPIDAVSWYEAAQFVNWLNTSTGHQAAYKFTGTQGTSDYTLDIWSAADADNGTNLYRHKDAVYYLPTEDEWVKAAYWNGTTLQNYATKPGDTLFEGDGTNGGWNYWGPNGASGPWNVGSGSEELNGTFDMMGNFTEWMENPYTGNYAAGSDRASRGGSHLNDGGVLASDTRGRTTADDEFHHFGFRVASEVPEPGSLGLISVGAFVLIKTRRRA